MGMRLGFTSKPDISIKRIVALTRSAEAVGFEYGWMFDSHVLWKEPFPLLTLMASNSKTLRLGTCVTNPAARDVTITASLLATLDLISGGRMEIGIGRGNSSRRVMGKQPTTFSQLEQFVGIFRDLTAARDERQRRAGARRLRHRNPSAAPSLSVSILPPLSGPRDRIRGSF
jgi:alkanesulfonate monooxygenase SsuD/methylene tetrahydromethanopterin reductase-like flavin-dependent oxidoreductase (luciferase family)